MDGGVLVTEGTVYKNRKELIKAGLHNHLQRGIGLSTDGRMRKSIVLSGGYEDDEDFGDEIIYTGDGGRDPKTGVQIANQTCTGGNMGLFVTYRNKQPVYVIRGSTHRSPYSPRHGYAFAGEYMITKYEVTRGKSGFEIQRFTLKKV